MHRLILFLFLILSLISCDKDSSTEPVPINDPALVGVWNLSDVKLNDVSVNPDQLDEIPRKLEVRNDGTGTAWFDQSGTQSSSFNWTTKGNNLTIVEAGGDIQIFTYCCQANDFSIVFYEESSKIELIFSKESPNPSDNMFAFNSTQGAFTANGVLDPQMQNTQGVGWYDAKTIYAYYIYSPTKASIAVLMFAGNTWVGEYSFSQYQAAFSWALNCNPQDSTDYQNATCMLTGGTVKVNVQSGSGIQGTFSGSGVYVRNMSQTTNVSNGQFSISGSVADTPEFVRRFVRELRLK